MNATKLKIILAAWLTSVFLVPRAFALPGQRRETVDPNRAEALNHFYAVLPNILTDADNAFHETTRDLLKSSVDLTSLRGLDSDALRAMDPAKKSLLETAFDNIRLRANADWTHLSRAVDTGSSSALHIAGFAHHLRYYPFLTSAEFEPRWRIFLAAHSRISRAIVKRAIGQAAAQVIQLVEANRAIGSGDERIVSRVSPEPIPPVHLSLGRRERFVWGAEQFNQEYADWVPVGNLNEHEDLQPYIGTSMALLMAEGDKYELGSIEGRLSVAGSSNRYLMHFGGGAVKKILRWSIMDARIPPNHPEASRIQRFRLLDRLVTANLSGNPQRSGVKEFRDQYPEWIPLEPAVLSKFVDQIRQTQHGLPFGHYLKMPIAILISLADGTYKAIEGLPTQRSRSNWQMHFRDLHLDDKTRYGVEISLMDIVESRVMPPEIKFYR